MSQAIAEEASVVTIEDKIMHILQVYPTLSPTMLQAGLGPMVKPIDWRPILEELINAGKIVRESESIMTPFKRYNAYTKLSLKHVKSKKSG